MFMAPENVPANRPPTSMHVPHAHGQAKSLNSPASPMRSGERERTAAVAASDASRHTAAATKPKAASALRARPMPPIRRASAPAQKPEMSDPNPPPNSGRPASTASITGPRRPPCVRSRYVGNQVT